MNFRTILLASATVIFVASSASASDLTNPFGLAGEGNFASDTRIETSRQEITHPLGKSKYDSTSIREEIEYGVNDNLSLIGSITNNFDTENVYNNDHNFDYSVGVAYNLNTDSNVLAQLRATYNTSNPEDYYGKHYDERWHKNIGAEARLGYDMGDGFIPYMKYAVDSDIDIADRDLYQSVFAGFHKYNGNWAVDAGFLYEFTTDQTNKNALYSQAEVAYYPTDNLSLSVYGDYYLNGVLYDEYGVELDKDYTTGVRLKYAF